MVSEAPPFWWKAQDWRRAALWPAAVVYGRVARRILDTRKREALPVPVICVGNFTVGGAGKTPTVMTLARAAIAAGRRPGLLSRGHGGLMEGPVTVEPDHHRAKDVGDEPLLLARVAPTVIARDRVAGARSLVAAGCDTIIMDDGFQSARLQTDFTLLVIDAARGIGNGGIIPAGPVRAPIKDQIRHCDALLTVGTGGAAGQLVRIAARAGKRVHEARIAPLNGARFAGRRVLAFAGIGDPDRFFRTLDALGADVVGHRAFPDHHSFVEEELRELLLKARACGLSIVTTAKDAARLDPHQTAAADLLGRLDILEIDMAFDDPAVPGSIIAKAVQRFKERRAG